MISSISFDGYIITKTKQRINTKKTGKWHRRLETPPFAKYQEKED
jgi:hypothetical protein